MLKDSLLLKNRRFFYLSYSPGYTTYRDLVLGLLFGPPSLAEDPSRPTPESRGPSVVLGGPLPTRGESPVARRVDRAPWDFPNPQWTDGVDVETADRI